MAFSNQQLRDSRGYDDQIPVYTLAFPLKKTKVSNYTTTTTPEKTTKNNSLANLNVLERAKTDENCRETLRFRVSIENWRENASNLSPSSTMNVRALGLWEEETLKKVASIFWRGERRALSPQATHLNWEVCDASAAERISWTTRL